MVRSLIITETEISLQSCWGDCKGSKHQTFVHSSGHDAQTNVVANKDKVKRVLLLIYLQVLKNLLNIDACIKRTVLNCSEETVKCKI